MENILSKADALEALKKQLDIIDRSGNRRVSSTVIDRKSIIYQTFAPGTLHDIYAATAADAVAVNAFGLGLALQASAGRPIVWCTHEMMNHEVGLPYGAGLHEMGLSPRDIVLVRSRDIPTLLGVGEEALRSPSVGAVLLSSWGEGKAFSLTASRRLAMAAKLNGGTMFLARASALPCPSAAQTCWSVASYASEPLEGGAPGRPCFSATLLRKRGSGETGTWIMEWDREDCKFRPPASLSGGLVSLAPQRPVATKREAGRRAA